jgi:hypothetical protein
VKRKTYKRDKNEVRPPNGQALYGTSAFRQCCWLSPYHSLSSPVTPPHTCTLIYDAVHICKKNNNNKKSGLDGSVYNINKLESFLLLLFSLCCANWCPLLSLETTWELMCKLIRYYIKWTARKEQQQPDVGIFLGWATMKKKRFRRSQQILSPLHTRRVWRSCLPNCFHSTHLSGWCCWQ